MMLMVLVILFLFLGDTIQVRHKVLNIRVFFWKFLKHGSYVDKILLNRLGVVKSTWILNTWEEEAGGFCNHGWPMLHSETMSRKVGCFIIVVKQLAVS